MVRLFSSMCACDACATCACSWWFVCDPYLVTDDVADDVTDDVTARMNQWSESIHAVGEFCALQPLHLLLRSVRFTRQHITRMLTI
jgi:hypothetical protein